MIWSSADTWIVITAMLCATASALPGCFLILRKMSMMGDAITHAVLPGLAVAFIVTGTRASFGMFFGAMVTGILTAFFTQWISRFGQVDRGASMGIVFTTLFAVGLVLISHAADHVDLDASCVLYGAIELIPLDTITWFGIEIPRATLVIGGVLIHNVIIIVLFFKEFRLSSFDPSFSDTMGYSAQFMHYMLMVMVAITTVACFEAVGSIIVIAMLIAPPATALLFSTRLVSLLSWACVFGILAAMGGHVMAVILPEVTPIGATTTSGLIAICAGIIFGFVWLGSCFKGRRASRMIEAPIGEG